jgi:hypothetical protein
MSKRVGTSGNEALAVQNEGQAFTLDAGVVRISAPPWSERLALVTIVMLGVIAMICVLRRSRA